MTDQDLQSAISQYKTMWESKEYIAYQEDVQHFNYMLNYAPMAFDSNDPTVTEKWFEDNWKITQFKLLEELRTAKKIKY